MRARSFAKECAHFDPPNIAPGPTDAEIRYHAAFARLDLAFSLIKTEMVATNGMPAPWRRTAMSRLLNQMRSALLRAIPEGEAAALAVSAQGRLVLALQYAASVEAMRLLFAVEYGDGEHHHGMAPR